MVDSFEGDQALAGAVIGRAITDYRGEGNPKPSVRDANTAAAFLKGKIRWDEKRTALAFWCEYFDRIDERTVQSGVFERGESWQMIFEAAKKT